MVTSAVCNFAIFVKEVLSIFGDQFRKKSLFLSFEYSYFLYWMLAAVILVGEYAENKYKVEI